MTQSSNPKKNTVTAVSTSFGRLLTASRAQTTRGDEQTRPVDAALLQQKASQLPVM